MILQIGIEFNENALKSTVLVPESARIAAIDSGTEHRLAVLRVVSFLLVFTFNLPYRTTVLLVAKVHFDV